MSTTSAIGRPLRRVDGGEKVTGLTRFAADLALPGMVHARLVLSPYAHARIVRIDTKAAAAVPGVLGVFTGRDLGLPRLDSSSRNKSPLAVDRVLFAGHPVVAVVADTPAIADDAAALVDIEYDVQPAAVEALDAMRKDAPRVRVSDGGSGEEELAMHGAATGGQKLQEDVGPNVVSTQHFTRGDATRGLAEADVVVEHRFTTPMVHQGYLEPRAALAAVDPLGALTVWTATQALFFTRSEVAEVLGMPEHDVKIVATPMGGGFGAKFVLLEPLAAALARQLRRPVSVVMTRREDFLATTPAPAAVFEMKLGGRRDGTLTALQGRVVFDAGAFAGAPVGIALLLMGSYYQMPNLDLRGYEVLTHKPGVGAYRAPGAVQGTFVIESLMDELAHRLGLDPLELRLRNASRPGDPMVTGQPWPKMGLRECLERLQQERKNRARVAPRDGKRVGVGVAVGGWMGGIEPANAACRLDRDGTVSIIVGSVDMSGVNTGFAQIAAEGFGVPVDDVRVVTGDSDTAPYAGASGGSKITYTVGLAVERAARDARRQLLLIAADKLEAAPDDLEIVERAVRVRGFPARSVSLADLAKAAMQFGSKYEPVFGRGASATTARSPAFAAHLTEVAVDPDTGGVEVLGHVAVQDVGRAINPAAVESQMHGGVVQGFGWALLERMAYDEQGQLLAATLMDYALPHSLQTPRIDTVIVEVPSDHGPFGAKGVGEPPVVGVPAAVANAVADAAGVRITELPITSAAVRAALAR
ncbi:MAG TPA: xanthine dehydrogenase family protein molybdopterin-binding subunit [Methylomirabilota bacterium]|jgi:CO/xanthine dehydrogenase Mo-binding subunit|nr:xanthine dehydrogenase family protein molybdopterin-binding subunit [Methylomirabilota bacterium]